MNGNKRTDREPKKLYEDKIISIGKVTKVTQGGRNFRFSATVAVGDRKGKVGIGTGKSKEIPVAVSKAIKEAEKMNSSAANSLLKFLEEPPGDFLAVLETDAVGRILPTIQSRCQVLHFQELSKEALMSGAAALISEIRLLSAMAGSETRPSKRLTRNPAERLAILTYLPTKSELVREIKSAELKSTSSTLELSL